METEINQVLTKKEKKELKRRKKLEQRQRQQTAQIIKGGITFAGIGFLVILFFLLIFSGKNNQTIIGSSQANEIQANDHLKGNKEAKVIFIEYSDFQCPACAAYYPIIKEIVKIYQDKVLFVYRHFPLRQIHPNAQLAAQAAVTAGLQNKFWEMHDLIFERQKNWSEVKNPKDLFIQYAQELALDIEKFKLDLDSKEVKDKVNADYNSAISLRLNGTPTFFLNGQKLDLPLPLEKLKKLIDEKLQQFEPSPSNLPKANE